MMTVQYAIRFDGVVNPSPLQEALGELGIPSERVLVGDYDPESGAPVPVAMVTPGEPERGFSTVLYGDAELAETSGLSELELGRFLAPRLNMRILVDDYTEHPDRWVLVAEDGSYGKVITDEEAADVGDLRIVHATELIAGAPEIPVVPEPNWAR